jgi:hypothetical protein
MSILKEYHAREFRKGIELVEDLRTLLASLPADPAELPESFRNEFNEETLDGLYRRCDEWLDWAAWEDKE